MVYKLKTIKEFIKGVNEQQTEPELVKKLEDELSKDSSKCPRCGEQEDNCICQERDSYSTINSYRIKKGDKHK